MSRSVSTGQRAACREIIEPERLEMFHVSSGEGPKFAAVCREMAERVQQLGPSPVKRQTQAAETKPVTIIATVG